MTTMASTKSVTYYFMLGHHGGSAITKVMIECYKGNDKTVVKAGTSTNFLSIAAVLQLNWLVLLLEQHTCVSFLQKMLLVVMMAAIHLKLKLMHQVSCF